MLYILNHTLKAQKKVLTLTLELKSKLANSRTYQEVAG